MFAIRIGQQFQLSQDEVQPELPVVAPADRANDVIMKGCPHGGTAAEAVSRVRATRQQIKHLV